LFLFLLWSPGASLSIRNLKDSFDKWKNIPRLPLPHSFAGKALADAINE